MFSPASWFRAVVVAPIAILGATAARAEDAFGTRERQAAARVGIFYDLKQTQQGKPIPKFQSEYAKALDEFLVSGFDEALLNRYYRAALPLYTTQLSIRRMNAAAAPRAFDVEDVVRPSYWVIHYKGQVALPADGTYRFVGNFDDVLIVAVNRRAAYGDWLDLKADEPVDLDILIGERPGSSFYGVLLCQKQGETYPLNAKGHIILPLFQTALRPDTNPLHLTDRPVWTSFD